MLTCLCCMKIILPWMPEEVGALYKAWISNPVSFCMVSISGFVHSLCFIVIFSPHQAVGYFCIFLHSNYLRVKPILGQLLVTQLSAHPLLMKHASSSKGWTETLIRQSEQSYANSVSLISHVRESFIWGQTSNKPQFLWYLPHRHTSLPERKKALLSGWSCIIKEESLMNLRIQETNCELMFS